MGKAATFTDQDVQAPVFLLKTNLYILLGGSKNVLTVWFVWTGKTNLILPRQNCQDKLELSNGRQNRVK